MDGAPRWRGAQPRAATDGKPWLAGTGACAAYDVVLILKRGRFDVQACQVSVTSERAPADPKVFTKINMHFVVRGPGLTDAAVERAVRLSHEKYCSASIMLAKTAEITTSFRSSRLRRRRALRRGSDVVCGGGHEPAGSAHCPAHRSRQCRRAGSLCSVGVFCFIDLHLSNDRTRGAVRWKASGRGGTADAVRPAAPFRPRSPG